MKRILSLLLLGWVLLPVCADDVSQQQALDIAVQFVSSDSQGQGAKAKRLTDAPQLTLAYVGRPVSDAASAKAVRSNVAKSGASASFYVFNRGGGQGWVIVSGNEVTVDPILAFSDKGDFSYETASEDMRWMLSNYAAIIGKARTDGVQPQWSAPKAAPQRPTIIVEPLLPVNYDQGPPYNDQCPVVDGKRCVTGCVATAVAQIMRYWQWP